MPIPNLIQRLLDRLRRAASAPDAAPADDSQATDSGEADATPAQPAVLQMQEDNAVLSLNAELADSIEALAERENRPPNQVASDLLDVALQLHHSAQTTIERWYNLTPRQQEVAYLILQGYTNRQIAAELRLSVETIKTHTHNIYYKLAVSNREELRAILELISFTDADAP